MPIDDIPNPGGARGTFDKVFLGAVQWLLAAVSGHWLLLVNLALGALAILPILAPALRANGLADWADPIYAFYGNVICHQLPERSFVVFGERMAYCERDTAIFTSMLIVGLLFVPIRGRLRSLNWPLYLLLIAPLVLDGLFQMLGFYESTWELRTFTGMLFGVANVWAIFPLLDIVMGYVHRTVTTRVDG